MPSKDLIFTVEGADAKKVAEQLADAFQQTFQEAFESLPPVAPAQSSPKRGLPDEPLKGDPLTIATFILAIPPAVLAVMEIADRIRKKKQTETVISVSKRLRGEFPETTIRLENPSGAPLSLHLAEADVVIDLATREAK